MATRTVGAARWPSIRHSVCAVHIGLKCHDELAKRLPKVEIHVPHDETAAAARLRETVPPLTLFPPGLVGFR